MIDKLQKLNDTKIFSVFDDEFISFGRIVNGYDFSELITYMKEKTLVPEKNNIYISSVAEMEKYPIKKQIENSFFGNMPVQIGYCNGRNSTYNGFEYHKGSEINIAVSDFVLVLGHRWDIQDNKYYVGNEKVFFVPKATAIEIYSTTLHLSPCRVSDDGFMNIVILPKGTNTPLDTKYDCSDKENALLLQKNKWVISHPLREQLINQGAFPGLMGENKKILYK